MREKVWGMRKKLRRPSYAELVATLALFIALGGASYAAIRIPKNSVGTKQIRKNAVNSFKVKNRSLLAKDFKAGQLPRGATGAQGIPGLIGPTGAFGATGARGLTVTGPTGATGEPGADGSPGAEGLQGPTGAEGQPGANGDPGADGMPGPTGADGSIGPTGPTGEAGPAGAGSTAVMSSGTSLAMFANEYFPVSGSATTTPGALESTTLSPGVEVTARNFRVKLSYMPGAGLDREIRLLDDGVVVLSCNMYWAATSCSDPDSAVIEAGSELVLYSYLPHLPGMGANNARAMVGFTLGP